MAEKVRKKSFFNKAIVIFLGLFLSLEGVVYLQKKGFVQLPISIIGAINLILVTTLTLFIINLILRFTVDSVFNFFKKEMEIEQRIFITKLYSVLVYAIGISFILYKAGVGINDIAIFLGLITTGVAFAIRDVILSFFAWMIILAKKPIRIGDIIGTTEYTGTVTRIGTFFVTLEEKKYRKVKIPNKTFLDKHIFNYGKDKVSGELRLTLKDFEIDVNKLISNIKSALKKYEVDVHFDTDGKDLFIKLSYKIKPEKEDDFRTNAILKIYEKHPQLFKPQK
ncbi:MAG: mechanosensitive ion channel family protein [Nanobdellota archaeon]